MRDTIELEALGVPVALITATSRIPSVTRKNGVFFVNHFSVDAPRKSAKAFDGDFDNPGWKRSLTKFAYHRQLRLAGCKEGDEVAIGGLRVKWRFPTAEYEENNWPSGFRAWHSRIDGIKELEHIETPDPTVGLSDEEIEQRVDDLTPAVLARLTDSNSPSQGTETTR